MEHSVNISEPSVNFSELVAETSRKYTTSEENKNGQAKGLKQ
jgi:hypothetical protein